MTTPPNNLNLFKNIHTDGYMLLNDKIKIDYETSWKLVRLRTLTSKNLIFDTNDNLWYHQNYKSKKPLIDLIYPDEKIIKVYFIS